MGGRLIGDDLSKKDKDYRVYYRMLTRSKSFRETLMHGGVTVNDYDLNRTLHLRLRPDGKTIFDDAAWYCASKCGVSGYLLN